MKILNRILNKNQGARTGKKLTQLKGLVIHWIGVAQPKASVIHKNFMTAKLGAHYISDFNSDTIIRCVPDDEVCYHVGADHYTDIKRKICGDGNPNWYLVGIECCISSKAIPDDYSNPKYKTVGEPSAVQMQALIEFCAEWLGQYNMTVNNLYLHNHITGKDCHTWFVHNPDEWERFKQAVKNKMQGGENVTAQEAIQVLVNKGVISSPAYWLKAIEVVKNMDQLLINMAKKL